MTPSEYLTLRMQAYADFTTAVVRASQGRIGPGTPADEVADLCDVWGETADRLMREWMVELRLVICSSNGLLDPDGTYGEATLNRLRDDPVYFFDQLAKLGAALPKPEPMGAVQDLGLSLLARIRLQEAGLTTIKQLTALREEDLRLVRGLGPKSCAEVINALAERGLRLQPITGGPKPVE